MESAKDPVRRLPAPSGQLYNYIYNHLICNVNGNHVLGEFNTKYFLILLL